jgi:hypothetical protein
MRRLPSQIFVCLLLLALRRGCQNCPSGRESNSTGTDRLIAFTRAAFIPRFETSPDRLSWSLENENDLDQEARRDAATVASHRLPAAFVGMIDCAASVVRAQDTVTGAFEGHVTSSQTGDPIKGATVEIVNQQTGISLKVETDYRGGFYLGLLIPGSYVVRVSSAGFQTREVPERIRITYAGEVVPIPVQLDPAPPVGTAAPAPTPPLTVEDTDIRSTITRIDGRRTGSFTQEEVSTLPLGGGTITRSFDELALLLPGVAPPPQTLGSVAGPGVGAASDLRDSFR